MRSSLERVGSNAFHLIQSAVANDRGFFVPPTGAFRSLDAQHASDHPTDMLEHVILPIRDRLLASGVERLGVFGSVARGDARPDSDVDVLVTFAPEQRTLDNLFEVGDAIEEAFHRRVDLITTDSLSPYIGPAILREVRYVDLGR